MPKILFSAPYMLPSLDRFQSVFKRYKLDLILPPVQERLDEPELLKYAGQFEGAICGDDAYTARVLEACAPRLKVISKWGTGINSIDSTTASRLGIRIYRTVNAFTLPVADTVTGYLLAFARSLPWMDKSVRTGKWEKMLCRALNECTLGVVGVGMIGKAVIRRAKVFGMNILGNDIANIDNVFLAEVGMEMVNLDDLLSRADFISLNCDLNPTSHHLISKNTLRIMKPTAVLVNTSRGPVVDEPELITALNKGTIAGAALDVFETEPLPLDSPLRKMNNVLLAPHNANSSPTAWEQVHWNTIRNLLEGLGIPSDDLKI